MKMKVYDATGKETGSVELSEKMFAAKINEDLMHRAVVRRLANARNPIAHTKTRGEVAATTKKAFKQKGTGNARRGALSTNLLRGGGVTHGPRNTRNFTKQMPRGERRAALFSSLTVRANDGALYGLQGLGVDAPSTKAAASAVTALPSAKRTLYVLPKGDLVHERSLRNLTTGKILWAQYLNPYDVLLCDQICFVGDALEEVQTVFTKK